MLGGEFFAGKVLELCPAHIRRRHHDPGLILAQTLQIQYLCQHTPRRFVVHKGGPIGLPP